jgi:hypothetical protein
MAIQIVKSDVDGMTGHFQVTFRVRDGDTFGPEETHGLWPHALFRTYHGDGPRTPESIKAAMSKWLKERHAEALARKQHIDLMTNVAHSFKGQVVTFE